MNAPLDLSTAGLEPSRPSPSRINVHPVERVSSALLGGLLIGVVAARPRRARLLLAAPAVGLLARGLTGHSWLYQALKVDTAHRLEQGPTAVQAFATVLAPPQVIGAALMEPSVIRLMMRPFASVEPSPAGTLVWTMGPVTVETALVQDEADHGVRFRSLDGAAVELDGAAHLNPAPAGRGTEVTLSLRLRSEHALSAVALAALRTVEHGALVKALRTLKSLVETGELPTLHANPSARAS